MQINLDTRNAPQDVVAKFWLHFHAFATLIASKVKVPQNCYLGWELKMLNLEEKPDKPARWEIDATVAIMTSARGVNHLIPLIQVGQIGIMEDGKVYWHSPLPPMQPGGDIEMTLRLIQCLETGNDGGYDGGHQYVVQNFPHFVKK